MLLQMSLFHSFLWLSKYSIIYIYIYIYTHTHTHTHHIFLSIPLSTENVIFLITKSYFDLVILTCTRSENHEFE